MIATSGQGFQCWAEVKLKGDGCQFRFADKWPEDAGGLAGHGDGIVPCGVTDTVCHDSVRCDCDVSDGGVSFHPQSPAHFAGSAASTAFFIGSDIGSTRESR